MAGDGGTETMYDYITKMGLEENPPPLDLDTKPKKRLNHNSF